MILVDTSIWIDHLTRGDPRLALLLKQEEVFSHPFVVGEVAMGSFAKRSSVLAKMKELPSVALAGQDEMLDFIQHKQLFGLGIGFIDAHLLASALITPGTKLWTRDKRLLQAAAQLFVAYKPLLN